jgi:hypothetical protein
MPNTLPMQKVTDALLRRRAALEAVHADGYQVSHWRHFDVVLAERRSAGDRRRAWVAQDDYFPEPGKVDPIPREWRGVQALLWGFGFLDDPGEPIYDTVTGVWIWILER